MNVTNLSNIAIITIILAIILLFNDKCSNSAKEKAGGILATGVVIFLTFFVAGTRSAGTYLRQWIALCLQFAAGVTGAILAILLLNEKECDSGVATGMLVTSIINAILALIGFLLLYTHYTLRPGKIQRYSAQGPRGGPGVPTDSWGAKEWKSKSRTGNPLDRFDVSKSA